MIVQTCNPWIMFTISFRKLQFPHSLNNKKKAIYEEIWSNLAAMTQCLSKAICVHEELALHQGDYIGINSNYNYKGTLN